MWSRHTYSHECVVSDDPCLEDEEPEWSHHDGACQAVKTKLPCLFSFTCARVDTCHKEDNVEGRKGIEDLVVVSMVQVRIY
jgi:hypothetical protein